MTVDECKKCKHHSKYENGAIYCKYDQNVVSRATTFSPKVKDHIVLACPIEQQ